MIELQNRLEQARTIVEQLLQSKMYSFQRLRPSILESVPGVYAIYDRDTGATLYVGRTKNIRRRFYTNHLMGPETNARLKKYLWKDDRRPEITTMDEAKRYLQEHCDFQYIREDDKIVRGQVEGLLSYLLDVTYIHEEH